MIRPSAAAGYPTGLTSAGGGVILSDLIMGDLQHMATFTKADLGEVLMRHFGATPAQADRAVDQMLAGIGEALAAGTTVRLYRFGNFTRATIKPRRGRNPRTGEAIDIPETAYITFSASRALKARLAGGA